MPDQDPAEVFAQLKAVLTDDPPWGVQVSVKEAGKPVEWWMTDPTGPAFEAAVKAMQSAAYGKEPASIGCGGTIGFVGPLADLFGGARRCCFGIDDPRSNPHAPNESLDEGDWKNLMGSLAHLFANLAELPGGKVRGGAAPGEKSPPREAPAEKGSGGSRFLPFAFGINHHTPPGGSARGGRGGGAGEKNR